MITMITGTGERRSMNLPLNVDPSVRSTLGRDATGQGNLEIGRTVELRLEHSRTANGDKGNISWRRALHKATMAAMRETLQTGAEGVRAHVVRNTVTMSHEEFGTEAVMVFDEQMPDIVPGGRPVIEMDQDGEPARLRDGPGIVRAAVMVQVHTKPSGMVAYWDAAEQDFTCEPLNEEEQRIVDEYARQAAPALTAVARGIESEATTEALQPGEEIIMRRHGDDAAMRNRLRELLARARDLANGLSRHSALMASIMPAEEKTIHETNAYREIARTLRNCAEQVPEPRETVEETAD